MDKNWGELAAGNWQEIREKRPLIHNITNLVVTNISANVLLGIGALPVMSHALEEVEEMVGISKALLLNIGTLTTELVQSMVAAGKKANELKLPVVLDPVGVGATTMRTEAVRRILQEISVAVLKGNTSEIAIIGGYEAEIKGVEAVDGELEQADIAKEVASRFETVVAVTGPQDFVSNGREVAVVKNGHPLMGAITGTGCMSAAVAAAFSAVNENYFQAAVCALGAFGLSGERAAAESKGPGSFQVALLDSLYNMDPQTLMEGIKVEIL